MDYKNAFNPLITLACFLLVFEVRVANSDYSSDAEFLKPLVLLDLFIMNIKM